MRIFLTGGSGWMGGREVNLADLRITAGVLLASPGRGGDALAPSVAENFPAFATIDFSTMTRPTLVVAGDKDTSAHLTAPAPSGTATPASNAACDALAAEPNPAGTTESK